MSKQFHGDLDDDQLRLALASLCHKASEADVPLDARERNWWSAYMVYLAEQEQRRTDARIAAELKLRYDAKLAAERSAQKNRSAQAEKTTKDASASIPKENQPHDWYGHIIDSFFRQLNERMDSELRDSLAKPTSNDSLYWRPATVTNLVREVSELRDAVADLAKRVSNASQSKTEAIPVGSSSHVTTQ